MIEKDELLSIMPHRGKMLLLDRVITYNSEERSLEAEYNITEDCLFFDTAAGGVPSWVGFEFIAQAISALSGIRSQARGEKPKVGFILSVSLIQPGLPILKNGSIAEIKVKEMECLDLVFSFEGSVFFEGEKILDGNLMVMEMDEQQAQIFMEKEHDLIG